MWTKLDDNLLDHPKLLTAGDRLGPNGAAVALGLYAVGLLWSNRHLTDGHLPVEVVKRFHHVARPLEVAAELVRVGLWEAHGDGFRIHDFLHYNIAATDVRTKRQRDRARKRMQEHA